MTEPYTPPEKAFVAFSGLNHDVAILWATPEIMEDLRDSGASVTDLFGGYPQKGGILVWEGQLLPWHEPDTPNGPGEWDVDYKGTFRVPTEEEWRLITSMGPQALAAHNEVPK